MKKITLLTGFSCLLGMASLLHSQTVITFQDFQGINMPSGWTQQTNATDGGWKVGTRSSLSSNGFAFPNDPNHSRFVGTNDDKCNCDKSDDLLISPSIDLSSYTGIIYLEVDLYYRKGTYQGKSETGKIEISTNGGSSFTVLKTLTGNSDWRPEAVDLSSYAGNSDVKIAFRYNDGGGWLFGMGVDNFKVFQPLSYDVSLTRLNLPVFVTVGSTATTVDISGQLKSHGGELLNFIDINWRVNGGAVHAQTVSVGMAYNDVYDFTHSEKLNIPQPGLYELEVWLSNLNGSNIDTDTSDNKLAASVSGVSGTAVRNVLVEEASGAWCGYCPNGALVLDSLRKTNNIIAVTIHGGDDMELANGVTDSLLDVLAESSYPTGFINRKPFASFGDPPAVPIGFTTGSNSHWYNDISQEKTEFAGVALALSNTYDPGTRKLTVDVKTKFLGPTKGNYNVNIYIIEDSVSGTGSGYDQKNYMSSASSIAPTPGNYYYNFPATIPGFQHMQVMRAMLGGAWGDASVIPKSVALLDSFSKQYTYTFPANWKAKDITIVGVVYKYSKFIDDRPVLNAVQCELNSSAKNSYTITHGTGTGIHQVEVTQQELEIFPNPISGSTVQIQLPASFSGLAELKVIDLSGKVSISNDYQISGESEIRLNTDKLPLGSYLVSLKVNNKAMVGRFVKIAE